MKRVYNILSIICGVAFVMGTFKGVDMMSVGLASMALYCLYLEARISEIEKSQ